MTPPRRLLSPQGVIAAIWVGVGGVNIALSLIGPNAGRDTVTIFGTNLCGLAVALLLSSATQRLMRHRSHPDWPALALLAGVAGAVVWAVDGSLQFWIGERTLRIPPPSAFTPIRYNWVYFTLIFALQTAALALLTANDKISRREWQLAEARLAEQQARLSALQMQMNPHFLFNALNALATLTAENRCVEAGNMIERLSSFLRTSLASEPGEFGTLEGELDAVQAYLDIESMRFGSRLDVYFCCEAGLSDMPVPNLILQPLVENAVKHAVARSTDPVTIEVAVRTDGRNLILSVDDDGGALDPAPPSVGAGVGLRNIAARLEALYGKSGSLAAGHHGEGYRAVICLPLADGELVV